MGNTHNRLSDSEIEQLMLRIIDLLIEEELWSDVNIYCLGKAFCSGSFGNAQPEGCFQRMSKGIIGDIYFYNDVWPERYLKWHCDI